MDIIEYNTRASLAQGVCSALKQALEQDLETQGRSGLAVAGGTTPAPIFDLLAQETLDWAKVQVMATDERWVPAGHDRSNAKLIRAHLLQGPAAQAEFLPFYQDSLTPEQGAAHLSTRLEQGPSVVLLGMGEDMHTASLFPGTEGLTAGLAADAPACVVMRPDSQPEARISLSARMINAAGAKHLAIFGEGKRDALKRAATLSPEKAPIAAVLPNLTVHWAL